MILSVGLVNNAVKNQCYNQEKHDRGGTRGDQNTVV